MSAPNPELELIVIEADLPVPLAELPLQADLTAMLAPPEDVASPFSPVTDAVRAAVRDLLRFGGYKPTGRGKPSSEYLVRAANSGKLSSINFAVDLGNVAALHSGIPISVIDREKLTPPCHVACGDVDSSFVFNKAGQEIRVDGLLCYFDADGPCANAVKDAQRTKTNDTTQSVTIIIWGTKALPQRADAVADWILEQLDGYDIEACARVKRI